MLEGERVENLEAVSLWKPSFAFRQILENVAFIVLMGYFAIEISRVIVQPSSILVPHSGKIVDGITSRVGFTIPANDLTKRGRSPKTFRIESSTPPSSSLSLSARRREVILPSIFDDAIYAGLRFQRPYTS